MKLRGSQQSDPALRALDIAEQVNEALWQEHQVGTPVPTGPVEVTLGSLCRRQTSDPMEMIRGLNGVAAKRTVYLCGGINGLSDADAKGWRDQATRSLWPLFEVRDPMARDYRGREAANVKAIVSGDLADMRTSDALLVNASKASWGTAMEVYAAHSMGRFIVAFGAGERPSPWLIHHCDALAPDLSGALVHLQEWSG
jgi:hypothetical protein